MISVITAYLAVVLALPGPMALQEEQPEQDLAGYKLSDLKLTGSTSPFIQEALRTVFGMKTGDPYDPQLIKEALEEIRRFFINLGYIDFTYKPQTRIDHGKKSVSCSLELFPGRQYYVRRISFSGSLPEDDRVIRSAFNSVFEEGMVFSTRQLDNAINNLNAVLKAKKLAVKDYELKRSYWDSTVDIIITLEPEDR